MKTTVNARYIISAITPNIVVKTVPYVFFILPNNVEKTVFCAVQFLLLFEADFINKLKNGVPSATKLLLLSVSGTIALLSDYSNWCIQNKGHSRNKMHFSCYHSERCDETCLLCVFFPNLYFAPH